MLSRTCHWYILMLRYDLRTFNIAYRMELKMEYVTQSFDGGVKSWHNAFSVLYHCILGHQIHCSLLFRKVNLFARFQLRMLMCLEGSLISLLPQNWSRRRQLGCVFNLACQAYWFFLGYKGEGYNPFKVPLIAAP